MNFILPLAIYNLEIFISIADDNHEISNALNKAYRFTEEEVRDVDNMIVNWPDSSMGRVQTTKIGSHVIMRVRNFPDTPELKGYLAHEVFHAATLFLNNIGMKMRVKSSDEAYAYLIGYITEKIYEKLESLPKKRKRKK